MYEFAKDFRNEGMDKTHNPEFTCMEIYVAYKDYIWMMEFVEKMLAKVSMAANPAATVKAFNEAENYDGPAIIIAYAHCIEQGLNTATAIFCSIFSTKSIIQM